MVFKIEKVRLLILSTIMIMNLESITHCRIVKIINDE